MTPQMFGNDYVVKTLADPVDSNSGQVDTISSDANAAGSIWPLLATHIMAHTGTAVLFVPCALGGTSITQWLPGANHQNRATLYGSMIYRALQVSGLGTIKGVLWWQGETDAVDGMSQATYNGHLDTIANAINDDLGVPLVPCQLQSSVGINDANELAINLAIAEAWNDNANVRRGPDLRDIGSNDSFHLTSDTNLQRAASRWWFALYNAFYEDNHAMASILFAKKNVAWATVIKLFPQSGTEWIASPTIATGDFKRTGYDAAGSVTLAIDNPTTLPVTVPAGSGNVVVLLSSAEMNNDIVMLDWKDASGAEFQSGGMTIMTTADGVDDLVTVSDAVASVAAGVSLTDGAITSAKFGAGAITSTVIATDAIDADALSADAVTKIQSGLLTTSAFNTKLGTPAGASVSADIAAVKAETASIQTVTAALPNGGALTTITNNVAAILADTGTDGVVVASTSKAGYSLASDQSGVTVGAVNALGAQAKADVNSEVLDVLNVDTFAEPTSAPAATSSLREKIGWIFKVLRNKMTQNATTQSLYADNGTTVDSTSTVADDGTTLTRGEWS